MSFLAADELPIQQHLGERYRGAVIGRYRPQKGLAHFHHFQRQCEIAWAILCAQSGDGHFLYLRLCHLLGPPDPRPAVDRPDGIAALRKLLADDLYPL